MKKGFRHCTVLFLAFSLLAVCALCQTTPAKSSGAARVDQKAVVHLSDDFDGLTFTNEQKAEIDQIYQEMKPRMDNVVKDEMLTSDQKGAMLDGYRRMEQRQIFAVLTPDQQKEVRKKINARHAAEQEKKKRQQSMQQ
jgi:Spy/CpxP family protein refolding chaperone